jgi:hypothetical protein
MLTLFMTIALVSTPQSLITFSDGGLSSWRAIIVSKHNTWLHEADVEPLKTHRKLHRLTYLFKIKESELTHDYLVDFHPRSTES